MQVNYNGLDKSREQTEEELLSLLKIHQKVGVVRPTGWGKSYLITKLCNRFSGKKLIIEPTNVLQDYIENFAQSLDDNVTIDTYQSLLHKSKKQLEDKYNNVDYIFLDEVHRAGAEKWGEAVELLCNTFKNAKVIGMSATPLRSDGNNIIDSLFNGTQVQPLYLADAIMQGLFPNPCYVTALYTITEEYNKAIERIGKSSIGKEQQSLIVDRLDNALLNYDVLNNIPNILQKYIFKELYHLHNMKFVVFCNKIKNIPKVEEMVINWFKECYGNTGVNKVINTYNVHCKKGKKQNIKIVKQFEKKHTDNTIDIMIAVNMFNEGLHINGVNGVILLRETKSRIVYFQQIGRVINCNNNIPVIFDFVNNYNSVGDGYLQIFSDYLFENCGDVPSTFTINDIFNGQGEISDTFKSQLTTINGDIINIHDETKPIMDIINEITKKTNMSKIYNIILDENAEWLRNNSEQYTIAEMAKYIKIKDEYLSDPTLHFYSFGIPKDCIREWLKKHKLKWNRHPKNFKQNILEYILTLDYDKMELRELWKICLKKFEDKFYTSFSVNKFALLLEENSITFLKKEEYITDDDKRIIDEMFYKKCCTSEISKRTGIGDYEIIDNYILQKRKSIILDNPKIAIKELSEKIALSQTSTRNLCKSMGLNIKNEKVDYTNKQIDFTLAKDIHNSLINGQSLEDISEKNKCSIECLLIFSLDHYPSLIDEKKYLEFRPDLNSKNHKKMLHKIKQIDNTESKTLLQIGKQSRHSSTLVDLARWKKFTYNYRETTNCTDSIIVGENINISNSELAIILNKEEHIIEKLKTEERKWRRWQ